MIRTDLPRCRCPICRAEFTREQTPAMPFCSTRCQQIDLGRWLGESYALPAEPERDDVESDTND